MPSSAQSPSKYSRRIKWLGMGVLVFIALYTGAWFWGASFLKDEIGKALAAQSASGQKTDCANLDIKGYPFRAGLFCDALFFEDPSQQIKLRLGAVRSATQVYDPMRGIVELDGPLELSLPGGETVRATWSLLHASARLARPLPKRASIEAKDIAVALGSLSEKTLLKAVDVQAHFRTIDQDMDISASGAGVTIDPAVTQGRVIPEFSYGLDAQVKNGVPLALSGGKNLARLLRGQSGSLRALTLDFTDGGGLTLTGPVSFDEAGLLTGDLSVTFSEAEKLGRTVEQIAPEIAAYVAPSLSLAASTAKPGENPRIDVTIRKGRASIGIIPLGKIPALE
jgi:hypothetical protein